MSDPNINRVLGNRYQLQELIGSGAMGKVYCAKDVLLGGVPVAVKFLALSMHNEKMRLQERFEQEAKTCALLGQRSIHVVRVMDYGVDENKVPFYVMEYLQGQSLSQVIRKQNLSLSRFVSITRQICLGLQSAHDGIPVDGKVYPIIHRDIKPSNILVIQDPSFGELVKVLDFGIAKLLQSNGDQTKFYLGTLAYSSPEQMEGKELDNRSDIYSLGVMMFEMLTSKMPLVAPTHSFGAWYKTHHLQPPRTIADISSELAIPQVLESLVMRCLAKTAKERPQNIGEILQVLDSVEQQLSKYSFRQDNQNEYQPTATLTLNAAAQPEVNVDSQPSLPKEKVTHNTSWPQNKPIADIVFPQPINVNGETVPALWIMLSEAEIYKRLSCTRYNQFLFITAPHPMLLWITVIHNRQYGAKWLPYYLDLKTTMAQEIVSLLIKTGDYRLLFFARESPNRCSHVLTATVAPIQRQRLQQWLAVARTFVSSGDPRMSKNLLKGEYQKIKPQVLAKLAAINTDTPVNLYG
ncbi:serine/threonine protein kinase [Nostoc sp. MS1]|uniref:serine/threonine protein kinase n=1 Tax=Nostoc sp. MS1 TaxID=2764711 RepID=UPI001CC53F9E|nr:serine/threonine-protein kinase [Nostoc sp. MS1]BCL34290.1 serine/threonine protein kinase [Nostoc sp. MS1]